MQNLRILHKQKMTIASFLISYSLSCSGWFSVKVSVRTVGNQAIGHTAHLIECVLCACTKGFAERRSFPVQNEESPKHSHHVEDDITQKGTRGHSERLDQRHAARNHCGDEYTGAC